MKNSIKLAIATLTFAFCTNAFALPVKEDGVLLKGGKMLMVAKDGTSTEMQKEMVATDGTKVLTDGTIVMKSGTKIMMRDGQMITVSGKLLEMKDGEMVPVPAGEKFVEK